MSFFRQTMGKMQNYAVYVENLRKLYGNQYILEGLNMRVEKGTIYGLLGPSGCGKTTLLQILVGRKKFESGIISVLGEQLNKHECCILGERVGFMPQDTALVENLTVKDTIYFFGKIYNMSDLTIAARYNSLHTLLDLPSDDRFVNDCSGGEKRRVSFAVAVLHKPELLILDEPTVGVDPLLRERIWRHIVELTRQDKTTVIITTHYIDECRQADKIGMMRAGRILVEENPNRLMQMYNTETLEEIFFLLSKRQNEDNSIGNIAEGIELQLQNHQASTSSRIKSNKSFKKSDNGRTRQNTLISKNRLEALLKKNWKQFYRNITGIMFLIFIPLSQICFALSAIGGDAKNIPLGIINAESVRGCHNFSALHTSVPQEFSCRLYNMSCRFLSHLDHPMISKVNFELLDDAKEAATHGHVAGVLYIPENFTVLTEKRLQTSRQDNKDNTFDLSQIKVWMDMSNQQIGVALKYKLIQLFMEFQKSVFRDCNFTQRSSELPMRFNFFHGTNQESYTVFIVPGSCVSILFLFGSILTCQIILMERKEGIWDRSIIAGVTSLEIAASHFVLQACFAVLHVIEILIVVFVVYQQANSGSMWLIFFMLYLIEICGMSYGFFVSVAVDDPFMSTLTLTGTFITMVLTCGIVWPPEGVPMLLRIATKCVPFTIPIEALRNVIRKGWTIGNLHVIDGVLVASAWTIIFGGLTVFWLKRSR